MMRHQLIRDLHIHLYYSDPDHWTWSFQQLSTGQGVIDAADLDPNKFYQAPGGLKICSDRIYCFLDVASAEDLSEYVHFLLGSLVQLHHGELASGLDRYISRPNYGDRHDLLAAVFHVDGSVVLLQEHGNTLALDYLDTHGDAPDTYGSPFFREILIETELWQNAAIQALATYFEVVQTRLEWRPIKPHSNAYYLQSLVDAWSVITKSYSKTHS